MPPDTTPHLTTAAPHRCPLRFSNTLPFFLMVCTLTCELRAFPIYCDVPWHHFPNKRPGAVHVEHNGSATTLVGTPQGLPPHVFTLLAGQVGSSASDTSLAAGTGGGFWLTFVLPKQGNANSIVLSSSPAATSANSWRHRCSSLAPRCKIWAVVLCDLTFTIFGRCLSLSSLA